MLATPGIASHNAYYVKYRITMWDPCRPLAPYRPLPRRHYDKRGLLVGYWFCSTTVRMSSASWRTRFSLVSHEHMKRAPPTPMNV
jgi:hypothetical protein